MRNSSRRWPTLCVFAIAFQVFIAGHALAQGDDPDAKALAGYRLTDRGLENFAEATRNFAAAVKSDPSLERVLEGSDDATIEETAATFDAKPAVRRAIESAGMTSSEYITFMYSMFQAGMAAWLVEEYGPETLPEGTPRENVDYYLANKDKLAALTAEMQQLSDDAENE